MAIDTLGQKNVLNLTTARRDHHVTAFRTVHDTHVEMSSPEGSRRWGDLRGRSLGGCSCSAFHWFFCGGSVPCANRGLLLLPWTPVILGTGVRLGVSTVVSGTIRPVEHGTINPALNAPATLSVAFFGVSPSGMSKLK